MKKRIRNSDGQFIPLVIPKEIPIKEVLPISEKVIKKKKAKKKVKKKVEDFE